VDCLRWQHLEVFWPVVVDVAVDVVNYFARKQISIQHHLGDDAMLVATVELRICPASAASF
jgi:hypothetical protein